MLAQLLSLVILPFPLIVSADAANLENVAAYSNAAPVGAAPTPVGPVVPDRNKAPNTITITLSRPAGSLPTSTCKNVQAQSIKGDQEKAEAVKAAFRYGWNGYKKYASGFDELMPLSANGTNNRYGWGLTIVDSIDTAIIMGLDDIVQEMMEFIARIDFRLPKTDEPVQMFETNIRYLGGLISAYDLLKSGEFTRRYNQQQVDMLLKQAVTLADKLAYGFNTPTGIPAVFVNFTNNVPIPDTYPAPATNRTYNSTNTASIGTFLLEFSRLSDISGNATYRRLAERANSYLINPTPAPVYPGLVGTQFDTDTGRMLTFNGGWQAGVDSFLEYLIKSLQYKPTNTTQQYKNFWLTAVQSTIQHIAVQPFGFPNLTFLSRLSANGTLEYLMDDFSCFAGGNFLLGGALLDMPQLTSLGIDVVDGCHQTYNTTATGLGPLAWVWFNEQNRAFDPTDENDAAARKSASRRGFFIPPRLENWFSRPEPLESIFYAYRITGEERWKDYAWEVFGAIEKTARNKIAYAAVNNVDIREGGSMSNNLDS